MYGYGHLIPAHAGAQLVAAAHEYRTALCPPQPADTDKILRGLRSATIVRDEDEIEARASFAMLRAHLAEVPIDILSEACRLYCNQPGRRFFPRSAGELRTFVNPLLRQRLARAARLERLAKVADDQQAERDRLAADPPTPEGIAAVMAEFGIRSSSPAPAAAQSRPEPTLDDYLNLGLTSTEAEQALQERARLLRRSSARSIANSFPSAIEAAGAATTGG